MMNGDVLDVNVRPVVPDVTPQSPAGVGRIGHSRPADRAKKVLKQDVILIPKDGGHNFPR